LVVAFALVLAAAPATADPDAAAKATKLFEAGKALREAGKTDEACVQFEHSLALDRQLGTMLNLADCREAQGKLIEAHDLFLAAHELAEKNDQNVRESYAKERADALIAKLGRVTLRVTDPPPGLSIELGGKPLPATAWAQPQLVEPGPIVVTASATGRQPATIRRDVAAGTEQTIEVVLAPIVVDQVPTPPVRRRSKLPLIVGGGGLVLFAGSVGLAFAAKSAYDDALADNAPDTDARIDKAQRHADIATGIGIAGLAAVGVGVVLYLRDRNGGVVVTPTPQRDGGTVWVTRSF